MYVEATEQADPKGDAKGIPGVFEGNLKQQTLILSIDPLISFGVL